MSTETLKKDAARFTPSGKTFRSVADMVARKETSNDTRTALAQARRETAICQVLTEIRLKAKLTQQQFAEKVGVTQGAVSKWETGPDSDLTLEIVGKYAALSGEELLLVFGDDLNHVESVKVHAFEIKRHLTALAELANKCDEMAGPIQSFFGEACFSIIAILGKCHLQMPNGRQKQKVATMSAFLAGQPLTPKPLPEREKVTA
jgi:transcriptional regulator with XRE-family HTH domain